jgi:pyrroline-5-carboxylate reductase
MGMKLGFVGTGTIAAAMVEGLCGAGADIQVVLSPRSAAVGAALAARFANVRVAPTNQAVLDASSVVVLAVRPQIASEVLSGLRFREEHHVVSLIATLTLAYLKDATAPAALVTRAVPLPSVARRQGPTAIYPSDDTVKALFDRLGTAIALDSESDFDAFTAATAVMASYFGFADTVASWMQRNGVTDTKAHAYVSQMLQGLAGAAPAAPGRSFAELAGEHQTRGGLNEQVLQSISTNGRFVALDRALDEVLARLRAGPSK